MHDCFTDETNTVSLAHNQEMGDIFILMLR